jgi:GNAT superfamily N-acetyltransferase
MLHNSNDGITIRSATRADSDRVRDLVFGILREFGFTPDPSGIDADLTDLEASYLVRGGAFELVLDGAGELLGCVGVYPMDEATAELRKMYLRPAARGRGLGRLLLDHSLARARELGFQVMVLQTSSVLKEAIALYRRYGFQPYQTDHRVSRCDVALRLELTTRSGPSTTIRGRP